MSKNLYPMEENVQGESHIVLNNFEGKIWIFPMDNVNVGMNIYQPSSWKGKMVKKILPVLVKYPFILKKLHIDVEKMKLEEQIIQYLQTLLGEDIKYSVFLGTPSPNQKVTMQINRGQDCIAYVKISDKKHIIEYFQKEYNLLKFLERAEMRGVPKAIGLKKLGDCQVFVQSGDKSGNESEAARFGYQHLNFLEEMYKKTEVLKLFSETEYAKRLIDLQKIIGYLGKEEESILQRSIEKVREFFSMETVFYLYHGDFTPWNMYLKGNFLQVFDFEYAKREYPKFLDIFHFYTQIWRLVRHKGKAEIWDLYCGMRRKWQRELKIDNINMYYMAYLLDIIHENLMLEEMADKKISGSFYELWLYLLKKLNGGGLKDGI